MAPTLHPVTDLTEYRHARDRASARDFIRSELSQFPLSPAEVEARLDWLFPSEQISLTLAASGVDAVLRASS